jgi:hypothetical protein
MKNDNSRAKLGVDTHTFDLILDLCSPDLNSFHGVKVFSVSRKKLLSKENLLALVLNWIREYPTQRSLSVTFGIPSTTVEEYLPRLVEILHQHLENFVTAPSRIQRTIQRSPLKGTCLFVDSYPIPLIWRPDFEQKESKHRSQYYWYAGGRVNKWAIKVQITLGLDGTYWDSSKAVPYAHSDQKLCGASAVPSILARDETLRGVGDLHYAKQQQFITKTRKPKTEVLKNQNKEIEKVRAAVEHSIAKLKDYKVIKGPYRGDRTNLLLVEKITRVVCAIINLEREKHPIQSNLRKWKSPRKKRKNKA